MDERARLYQKLGRRKAEALIKAVGLELALGIVTGEQDKSLDAEAEVIRTKALEAQKDHKSMNIREQVKEYAGRANGDLLVDWLGADYALTIVTARPPAASADRLKALYKSVALADNLGMRWREPSAFWGQRQKASAADIAQSVSLLMKIRELGMGDNELVALVDFVGEIQQVEQILDILLSKRR